MMADPQDPKKAQPQKKLNQKLPKEPKQAKQERRTKAAKRKNKARKPKQSSNVFVSKILQQLCQGKALHPVKDNENAVFSQRYFLTNQVGQQQCFLSDYFSSQGPCGTMDSLNVPVVSAWPYKPTVTRWTATMYPPQQCALTTQLWPEGQQQYIFSHPVPSQALYSQMSTLSAKELRYEVNERMSRQSVMCLFVNKPGVPRY